jgi:hypothetical protein
MGALTDRIKNLKYGDITLNHLKREFIEYLESVFGKEGYKKYMPFVLMKTDLKMKERKDKLVKNGNRKGIKRDTAKCTFICDPKITKRHVGLEDGNSMLMIIEMNDSLKELVENAGSIGSFTAEVDKKYKEIFKD